MRAALLAVAFMLITSAAKCQPAEEVRLAGGATEAADGFYVRISGGHVEARPAEWPLRTIWFTVRAPLKVRDTDLADCVFHIEGRGNELLATLHLSMSRDKEKKEGAFDLIVVPELAKKARLTLSYQTPTEVGPRISKYYTLQLRDHIPKPQ